MPKAAESKPHLVFVGCPWSVIRAKYERIFSKRTFKRRYPLSFLIVGRDGNQLAEDLFAEIKRRIETSSRVILDVSGGNANVALEFGYAEGKSIPAYVFVNENKQFARRRNPATAIISDLSGLRRNPYKNENALKRHLHQFADQLPYTQRVHGVAKRHHLSKNEKAALMSIPRAFTDRDKMRRAHLKDYVVTETGCTDEVAERAIEVARRGQLIRISVGQHGYTKMVP